MDEETLAQAWSYDDKWEVNDDEAEADAYAFMRKLKASAWDEAFEATCEAHDVYGGLDYTPKNPYRGDK